MPKLTEEMIEAIKYSTTMEINGRSFYEEAAKITHNEYGKKVFEKLAKDEIEHIKKFGEIFTSALDGEEWKKYLNQEENNKESVLDKLKARIEKQGKEERASDLEALRIGMELERDSIDYYKKLVDNTEDQTVKQVFSKIIEEEKYHYDLLQAEYDQLTGSGFWFDIAEFRMDGKF